MHVQVVVKIALYFDYLPLYLLLRLVITERSYLSFTLILKDLLQLVLFFLFRCVKAVSGLSLIAPGSDVLYVVDLGFVERRFSFGYFTLLQG